MTYLMLAFFFFFINSLCKDHEKSQELGKALSSLTSKLNIVFFLQEVIIEYTLIAMCPGWAEIHYNNI